MDSHLLLPEILSRIFSSLHIDDRKRVRLVCRRWNECCNCPAILRDEKFVFRDGYPLEDIDSFLQNCRNIRNTVEFQGISLPELSSDIWRIIGNNIHTMTLTECIGWSENAKDIFLHCVNMHSFRSSQQYQPQQEDDLSVWLDELIQLNVQRPQLTNFKVFFTDVEISKDNLLKIFKIFPYICNFGTGYSSYLCYIFAGDYRGSFRDTFNPVLLKEISFNVPCDGLWLQEFSNIPELRLQKLETILWAPTIPLEIFAEFFQNQPELKTLKITLLRTNKTLPKTLLFKIVSICSELIDFRFKCDVTLLKMDELYRTLLQVSKSKLECFMLWFVPCYDVDDKTLNLDNLPAYLTPLMNKKLRTLKLYSNVGLGDFYCSPILRHFCDLHHLEIAAVSDKILQTIFEHHIHLQTLVLYKIGECTTFGFTGCNSDSSVTQETTSYSISRLQELTHLELEGFLSHRWIEETLRQLDFPRLKYLRLSLWGLEEEIDLEYLPAMIPSVEVLIFDEVPLRGYQYVYFCENLQKLKLILYTWLGQKKMIEDMFIARPCLKYAVDSTYNAYFYDRFKKNLRMVNFKDIEFRRSVFSDFIQM